MVLSTPGRCPRERGLPTALWVVPVSDLGGVARHVLDVADVGLPGWRLVVVCPAGPLAERLREAGAAVATARFGPAAGFGASVLALRQTVRALRTSIVHAHLAYADLAAAAAVAGTGARLATTEHGIAYDDTVYHGSPFKARLMAAAHRARFATTDVAIAVSAATRSAMVEKWRPGREIAVIPNGVDAAVVRSRVEAHRTAGRSGGLRVLSLSRLSAEKRLLELLQAFAMLRRSRPDATLVIAGEGPERAPLEAAACALGLGESVAFPGFVEPYAAMGAADVVVQLSVWENCSYTLLDAAAAGLGVVATPVGGNPEILPQECLVDADDAEGVARAIERQAVDGARRPFAWVSRREMADRIARAYGGPS
ncbi:glycosyltransferase family 4 protein [Sinomonas sp. ASV322]|uniref:glycosyltransferase family 4 protein n=1 Tax=Sinomonas sp. ASV322 TaxID=3041920 RepID=UPI0027DC6C49|nr:glycosyltransferase family 4 protein [Sinomonas sp. ASV322]MDQ4501906.1 glycosyltransferase family 4 protein [Sinomonas sp. ASV322]